MINRTKFQVEVYESRYADIYTTYSASGYIKELNHELLIWDLEIEEPAWAILYAGCSRITFIINDVRYTDITLRDFYGEVDNTRDCMYYPAAHVLFTEKD